MLMRLKCDLAYSLNGRQVQEMYDIESLQTFTFLLNARNEPMLLWCIWSVLFPKKQNNDLNKFFLSRDCSDDFTIMEDDEPRVVKDIPIFANSWKALAACSEAGSEPFCSWGPDVAMDERLLTGKQMV